MANGSSSPTLLTEERRSQAHEFCSQYLGGSWNEVPVQELEIKPLLGGLSNYIFFCSLPESYRTNKKEIHSVLLRIYGRLYQQHVNDVYALVQENVIFALLAERKIAPKIYAIFPEGRLEEFVPARSLFVSEIRTPGNSVKIARKMKQFHGMTLPLCKQTEMFWEMCKRHIEETEAIAQGNNKLASQVRELQKTIDLRKEFKILRNFVDSQPSPVVFCHNDIQEGNILAVPKETDNTGETSYDVMFIDYEYCSYNNRGFDIANHFCEWTWDLGTKDHPYFELDLEKFPTTEEQLLFFRAYLGKDVNSYSSDKISREEQDLLEEVKRFRMISEFFWGVWGIVQAKLSHIQFGYMEYGSLRLKLYQEEKKKLGL